MAKKPAAQEEQQQQPVAAEDAAQSEGGGALLIDLSGVEDEKELPVIPRGIYDAQVDDLTFGHSQASGNPMWTFKLELLESAGEYANRKLFFHLPFVDTMMPRVKKTMSRIAPELLSQAFSPEKIAAEGVLIGKQCKVRVDVKPYEGKPRNNVRELLPPGEGGGGGAFLQAQ